MSLPALPPPPSASPLVRNDSGVEQTWLRWFQLLWDLLRSQQLTIGLRQTATVALTTLDPVETSFPVSIALAAGMPATPAEVRVRRVRNLTSPGALQYTPPHCQWDVSGSNVRLLHVDGIYPSTSYELDVVIEAT